VCTTATPALRSGRRASSVIGPTHRSRETPLHATREPPPSARGAQFEPPFAREQAVIRSGLPELREVPASAICGQKPALAFESRAHHPPVHARRASHLGATSAAEGGFLPRVRGDSGRFFREPGVTLTEAAPTHRLKLFPLWLHNLLAPSATYRAFFRRPWARRLRCPSRCACSGATR